LHKLIKLISRGVFPHSFAYADVGLLTVWKHVMVAWWLAVV